MFCFTGKTGVGFRGGGFFVERGRLGEGEVGRGGDGERGRLGEGVYNFFLLRTLYTIDDRVIF